MANDLIPKHRLEYIDLKLKELIRRYNIEKWPVDCIDLLVRMKEKGDPPVRLLATRSLKDDTDACTIYSKEQGYIVKFNKNKFRYPFVTSADRRTNFTAAHEIGHISLEHLLIPARLKSGMESKMEELEANEFAARLLMPDRLIFSCNYHAFAQTAAYMNVSKAALRRRLANMGRIDMARSQGKRSCFKCGNTSFSAFARFCCICGDPIDSSKRGIRRVVYPVGIPQDRYKRALACPKCGTALDRNETERCSICGTYVFNYCTGYFEPGGSECSYANPGNARYCEMCGRPTCYLAEKYLAEWDGMK